MPDTSRPSEPGAVASQPALGIAERFGVRSLGQLGRDLGAVVRDGLRGARFQFNVRSAAILRPSLAFPAYAGRIPKDGLAPVFNLFDRVGGGQRYTQRVSRTTCRDYRGGALTYDEHDGTDFACPIGTPLCAAAPGVVVMIRDRWLRGGLTVAVDHGSGVVTQYTHCARAVTEVGQQVTRGEPVALSGASGYDLVQFFPWLAPHIHFLVMHDGRPTDPFLAAGEPLRPGTWLARNHPTPSGPLPEDASRIEPSEVSPERLERVAEACLDDTIRDEFRRAGAGLRDPRPARAALLEDALCHDSWAFPESVQGLSVRPERPIDRHAVPITLPLPASSYRGCRLADTLFSAPR